MRASKTLKLISLSAVMAFLLMGCGLLPFAGGEPEIEFWASQEVIPPGECVLLHWEVRNAGDYPVFLNGEQVPPEGEEEVCLERPEAFELVVGAPGGPYEETVTIEVEGEVPPEGPPPEEPPPGEPPPGEPPPEEPPPGGPEVIFLVADPDAIPQGGCAMLRWEVLPPGEWRVLLDGQEVPHVGEEEVCPAGTTTYELLVEAPGGPQTRQVTLRVESGPGPEPTPPPPQATPTSPPQATPPPPQPTATPAVPPGGGQWGVLSTDLAVTDLYADKLLNGTVYGRLTNHGPETLTNMTLQFSCEWAKTAYGDTLGVIEQMGPRNITITSLNPGQTAAWNTYITVDLTQYWYNMTCSIQVDFNDPNTANNSYSEILSKQ